MRNSKKALAGVALSMACLLSAMDMPVASAAGNSSATGGGTAEEAGALSTFVFNAVKKSDGSVTGNLVYQVRGLDVTFMMTLDCLVVTGKVATISGVVTHVIGDGLGFIFVGQEGVFKVEDNGQGSKSNPDLFSDMILQPGANCFDGPLPAPYIPVSGNIQVR